MIAKIKKSLIENTILEATSREGVNKRLTSRLIERAKNAVEITKDQLLKGNIIKVHIL